MPSFGTFLPCLIAYTKFNCTYCMADLDECEFGLDSCDINADCKNTIGSYKCECRSGYRGNGIICNGIIVLIIIIIAY